MGKDHTPSGFNRPSGYQSDLEVAETGPMVKSINTSFGSKNHNSYVMLKNGTHEHFYYNPKNQRSGWHGNNFETRNNKPNLQTNIKAESNGGKNMERSNSFVDSLKVDQATINRCNDVSRNFAKNSNNHQSKSADNGGRERGDSGPGSLGRESGLKTGGKNVGQEGSHNGQSANANSAAGHTSGGEGGHGNGGQGGQGGQGSGGHGGGGQGSGGQGSGGHGGGH